jgi:hypothetical protein
MPGDGNTKKVEFRLEFVDTRLVVLANVRSLFTWEMTERLRADSIAGHMTKEKLMKRFVFNMSEPVGRQNEPFPMYGESDILRSADQIVNDMKMIRAITRIDIVNSIPDDKATIDSVYLLHTKNKGFVAPGFDRQGAIVGTPNVPDDAQPNANIFGYKFVQNAGSVSPAMEREIYITEDRQDTDKPTAIILKISRDGHPTQFYRVDMRDRNGELLPILRNYRYRINLTKILGDGYPTAEAADLPKPSLSSTVETNELGISAVVFNDQYKLGVSAANISFRADGSWDGQANGEESYSLKVHTTYSGWSASWKPQELAGWIELTGANMEEGNMDFPASHFELKMKATPNATGKVRNGTIRLTAGMLHLEIHVTQHSM